MREAAVLLDFLMSGKGLEMPDSVSQIDVRSCTSCGRPFVPAHDAASDACEECSSSGRRNGNQRSAKASSLNSQGKKSSGSGSWNKLCREDPSDESNSPEKPKPGKMKPDQMKPDQMKPDQTKPDPTKPDPTKWRSPPFAIRFPETDTRELPAIRGPKRPSRLARLLRSRDFFGVVVILAVAGVLMSRYGVPPSIQRMGNKIQRGYSKVKAKFSGTSEQPEASRETGSDQQAQEIRRVRQQSDDKYWLQQKDARTEQQKRAAAALKKR